MAGWTDVSLLHILIWQNHDRKNNNQQWIEQQHAEVDPSVEKQK